MQSWHPVCCCRHPAVQQLPRAEVLEVFGECISHGVASAPPGPEMESAAGGDEEQTGLPALCAAVKPLLGGKSLSAEEAVQLLLKASDRR